MQNYYEHALDANNNIRNLLRFGSNSPIDKERSDFKRLLAMRVLQLIWIYLAKKSSTTKEDISIQYIKMSQPILNKYGYGHCGEISSAGFSYLINKGIYPIELCNTTEGGHDLILLGRDPDSDVNDIDTWGENAYFCDIWINEIYPAQEFIIRKNGQDYKNTLLPNAPYYLAGDLCFHVSILNYKQLISFKKIINQDNNIDELFTNQVNCDADLINDIPKMQKHYENISTDRTNEIMQNTFKEHFNELLKELNPKPQNRLRFYQPQGVRYQGCEPPSGSYKDEEGRTIVPSL